jgi:eukaryotic-like serine/threonine-protein kinase
VVALIVAGVLLLSNHPAASGGSGSNSPTVSGQASSSAPASTAPAAGPTIPSAFAGTWTGTATISAIGVPGIGLSNPITFTFVTGATTISETNQACVNTLTLTGKTATVLTFNEPQTTQCVAGTVTFTLHGTTLAYRWTGGGEQNVADLHKT